MQTQVEVPERVETFCLKYYRDNHLPIYIEQDGGYTIGSKKFICEKLPNIYGKPTYLFAYKPNGPDNCMDVWTVIGFEDCAVVVRGFSFGYSGEGSRGLEWATKIFRLFNKTPHSTIFEPSHHSEICFG